MHPDSPAPAEEPPHDCPLCPRLVAFRQALKVEHPGWWNAPVPALGDPDAWLAIVGLAPGKHGANRTGRPFTGDFAGELLFEMLGKFGLAEGRYDARADDGLKLRGAAIINAVKCLPPANKPTPEEIATCRRFLAAQIAALPGVRVFLPLGQIAHASLLKVLGVRAVEARFGHLAEHRLADGRAIVGSYHCSRYNQNTGRLTRAMFEAAFARAVQISATSRP